MSDKYAVGFQVVEVIHHGGYRRYQAGPVSPTVASAVRGCLDRSPYYRTRPVDRLYRGDHLADRFEEGVRRVEYGWATYMIQELGGDAPS